MLPGLMASGRRSREAASTAVLADHPVSDNGPRRIMRAMTRYDSTVVVWALIALLETPVPSFLHAQAAPAAVREQASPDRERQGARRTARLTVTVPHADTVLSLDGRAIVGSGITREVETPPFGSREQLSFTLMASWNPNTYTTMTRTKGVLLRAGERLAVDLTREEPGDRVRIVRSTARFQMVVVRGQSFYQRLREKLGWGGQLRINK